MKEDELKKYERELYRKNLPRPKTFEEELRNIVYTLTRFNKKLVNFAIPNIEQIKLNKMYRWDFGNKLQKLVYTLALLKQKMGALSKNRQRSYLPNVPKTMDSR